MCIGMKAELDNKGQWLAWGINKIYEEINKGIPGYAVRRVPSDIGRTSARI